MPVQRGRVPHDVCSVSFCVLGFFWGSEALENQNINFLPQISMFEVDSAAVDWLWHLLAMREVEVCLHTHFCVLFVFFFVWLPIDRLINYHAYMEWNQ